MVIAVGQRGEPGLPGLPGLPGARGLRGMVSANKCLSTVTLEITLNAILCSPVYQVRVADEELQVSLATQVDS